jgi:hypothetical protein
MNTVIQRSLSAAPDLEVSVQAAAVLLSLAMRDTEHPVADLGQALSRMVTTVTALRKHAHGASSSSSNGMPVELESELSLCIQSLQFHDRLIQQLAAVRNLLASLASHGTLDVAGFGAQRWEELLRILRERLSADQHHQLFDLLMRTGAVDNDGAVDNELRGELLPAEGSVELF